MLGRLDEEMGVDSQHDRMDLRRMIGRLGEHAGMASWASTVTWHRPLLNKLLVPHTAATAKAPTPGSWIRIVLQSLSHSWKD